MKRIIAFTLAFAIIMLLTACASSNTLPKDEATVSEDISIPMESEIQNTEEVGGAPPSVEFSTVEEVLQNIKEVKETGAENVYFPWGPQLYGKEHIYLLKENPLLEFENETIMLVLQGTAILYQTDDYSERAVFSWSQGYETAEKVNERITRYNLEHFENTKFYFGELFDNIHIFWWENGDQFEFSYPVGTNIFPEDIIEHLVVEKYDV